MNYSIAIFQGLFDSLETPVSSKLMAASMFYYYSVVYDASSNTILLILLASINTVHFKGYLCYKTVLGHKVALDV